VIAQPRQPEFDAFDRNALSDVPASLQRFARKETIREEPGRERRQDRRYSLITNVTVTPVDKTLRPLGPSFVALSSGMSVSGIRLIHTQPPPSKYLLLKFEGQTAQFVLSVLRSRPVGDCFEIAGRLSKPRIHNQETHPPVIAAPAESPPLLPNPAVPNDEPESAASLPNDALHWAGVSAAAQVLGAESRIAAPT
jgi:hypothetical protein